MMSTYPKDWPKCRKCGDDAMDGHITCGRAECDEHGARREREDHNYLYGALSEKKSAADKEWERRVKDGLDLFKPEERELAWPPVGYYERGDGQLAKEPEY